jgi:hypothetical protein
MSNRDWLDGMEIEGQDLEERIVKLTAFLDNPRGISNEMRALLMRQLGIMHLYASVMQERYTLHLKEVCR